MVTLTSYPVISESGKVKNIFAGFDNVELLFKREDTQIVDVSEGVDAKILISITGDITANLNVGEWIYLYSVGNDYTYDNIFQITNINFASPNTEITVDGDFIEVSTGGYCNYKQNYYLESKLVNPTNNAILNYPKLLQNDGSPSGVIKLNVSMPVDFLTNDIKETSQEITDGRIQFKVMYREVWRENSTNIFTLVDDNPIIIIYTSENTEIESFVNGFDTPKVYAGYPFVINLTHSLQNYVGKRVSVLFDENDINKTDISTLNPLFDFSALDYGILQANLNDNTKIIDANTKYIKFNAYSNDAADYETNDYNDTDYLTINS